MSNSEIPSKTPGIIISIWQYDKWRIFNPTDRVVKEQKSGRDGCGKQVKFKKTNTKTIKQGSLSAVGYIAGIVTQPVLQELLLTFLE